MGRGKKVFRSNSFVTILGVILIITIAYFGYQYRFSQATKPIKVPYARTDIAPYTEITQNMLDYIDVPQGMISDNVHTNLSDIIGKYTKINYTIPKGSMFFKTAISDASGLANGSFLGLNDGEVAHTIATNVKDAYGNALTPDLRVDLYYRGNNKSGKTMYGEFVKNVRVLAVKDTNGKDLKATNEEQKPAYIIVAASKELSSLLGKVDMISGASIVPVVTSAAFDAAESHSSPDRSIKDYINSRIAD